MHMLKVTFLRRHSFKNMNGGFICIFKRETLTSFLLSPYVEYFCFKKIWLKQSNTITIKYRTNADRGGTITNSVQELHFLAEKSVIRSSVIGRKKEYDR